LSLRKTNLARLLARRPDGIFVAPFEQGEIGPDFVSRSLQHRLEGLVSKRAIGLIAPAGHPIGSSSKTEIIRRWSD
jgi:hypothetical protein